MSLRRAAGLLVAFGLMVGLISSGVGATFTDSATAQMNIHVGTLGIKLSTTTGTVSADGKTVTCTAVSIQSSVAGSAPCSFTVTSTGTIPALIHIAVTTAPAAPFTDLLGSQSDITLAQGATHTYAGGVSWPELAIAQLGMSTSITYTISATA